MNERGPHPSSGVSGNRPALTAMDSERFAHFTVCRLPDGNSDCLGAGAMGITYRAYDEQLERYVALKVISPQHLHNPALRVRFLREAKAAARLQHPNIANVLFQGEQNGMCFYVMELVSGESLESYVTRTGPLEPVHALQICHQITLALDAAYKEQLLHRDLKPGNIMLTSYHNGRQHHVKVIDFGLAKFLSETPGTFATMSGFLGTPSFASPEQCQELEIDCRSDLYSLGATLWFILSGRAPFQGGTLSVIQAHVYDALPLEILGDLPEPVLELLRRLMAKRPEDRPSTPLHAAYEIECALEALGGSQAGPPPPPLKPITAPEPIPEKIPIRKKPALLALIFLCLLIPTGTAYLYFFSSPEAKTEEPDKSPVPLALPDAGFPEPSPPTQQPVLTTIATAPDPVESTASPAEPPKNPVPAPSNEPSDIFINSLGMRFVKIPGLQGRISIWETRVEDFAAFIKDTGDPAAGQVPKDHPKWDQPGFPQSPQHPVVHVSFEDARRFCQWLTRRERELGLIAKNETYRLPEPYEFDQASGNHPDATPGQENTGGQLFLWGYGFPHPTLSGNLGDQNAVEAGILSKGIENYRDGHSQTSPVGSFPPNSLGLFDLSGNVWELITIRQGKDGQIFKSGGGWKSTEPYMVEFHYREGITAIQNEPDIGFRCFLSEENTVNRPSRQRP